MNRGKFLFLLIDNIKQNVEDVKKHVFSLLHYIFFKRCLLSTIKNMSRVLDFGASLRN